MTDVRAGTPTPSGSSPSPETTTLWSMPLWILAGQSVLVLAIVLGFGAYPEIKPNLLVALIVAGTGCMVLLGPVRQVQRIVISFPVLIYLTWWMFSYFWTYNDWVFISDTQWTLPLVVSLTAVVTLLPYRAVTRGLVLGCQTAIAYTLVYTVLHFGLATTHLDGSAGWRGSFIHKNGMAPFMLFAILTFACFERRPLLRTGGIGVAVVLVLLSQSTTSAVVGAMLIVSALFLRKLAAAPKETWSFLLTAGSVTGIVTAYLGVVNLPTLVGAAGKDPTLTARTDIWAGAMEAISRRPWTGYGIGGVWINNDAEPTRTILRGLGFIVYHSHNGFLEIWLQLGLIGLALFAALIISYYRTSLRLMLHDVPSATFFMLFGALIVLVSISEVATFGIWLVLLCAFHAVAIREVRRHEGELVEP